MTALFTTANARLRLYNLLSWFHHSQIIYCDTDSVYVLIDPDNPDHKCPEKDKDKLPPGQWEFDLDKETYIVEMIVNGCKSYAYKLNTGKEVIRQKGITLDYNNSKKFTFENFKRLVLKKEEEVIESRPRFRFKSDNRRRIFTTIDTKNISFTLDKKRFYIESICDTYPFGYDDGF